MSRVGKEPIPVPKGVKVSIEGRTVTVAGPKGTLTQEIPEPIEVIQEESLLRVTRPDDEARSRSMHGLSRTLVANLVTGVTEGFTKRRLQPPGSFQGARGDRLRPHRGWRYQRERHRSLSRGSGGRRHKGP